MAPEKVGGIKVNLENSLKPEEIYYCGTKRAAGTYEVKYAKNKTP
jgi:hypothetical protein